MPQKLIRLTTPQSDDNTECVFTGLFNEDLEIAENSEIALHSLSVERRSQEIRIKKSNNALKFASVNATASAPSTSNQSSTILPLDTYNKSNNLEFLNRHYPPALDLLPSRYRNFTKQRIERYTKVMTSEDIINLQSIDFFPENND